VFKEPIFVAQQIRATKIGSLIKSWELPIASGAISVYD
jgi:hypothetical protein